VPEHISRKELKQDKIKETFEHGAEALLSHQQLTLIVLLVVLVAISAYQGFRFYNDRQSAQASGAYDAAMKLYSARIGGLPDPTQPNEPHYADEASRSQDALRKFTAAADKYPSTYYGKVSRYYAALCLEDLERQNQALEELKKLSSSSDKEIAAMAQYQTAVIDARTGKPDEASKIYRALADKSYTFVPRVLVQLELAGLLRQSKPQEALTIYQQIKKDFPNTTISEEADRGIETLSPAS
jgi:predicted negative regulator of RcsB-dependent stress response